MSIDFKEVERVIERGKRNVNVREKHCPLPGTELQPR